jgi:hypothetical protein
MSSDQIERNLRTESWECGSVVSSNARYRSQPQRMSQARAFGCRKRTSFPKTTMILDRGRLMRSSDEYQRKSNAN